MGSRLHALFAVFTLAVLPTPSAATAQERLSLSNVLEAVLKGNPELRAVREAAAAADQHVPEARAGWLPHVDVTTSWQRGDQPVFVFGSLLAQRQFAASNFALAQLNNPGPLNNLRTAVAGEQLLFDGGRARAEVHAASMGTALARSVAQQTQSELRLAAARAYGEVLAAAGNARAAESAVTAAREDLRTAEARRDSGGGTEADVLSMQVHLARMEERAITEASRDRIGRAALNRLMAEPLDRQFVLEEPVVAGVAPPARQELEARAVALRPEAEQARLRQELARAVEQSAISGRLPQVAAQGGFEWNDGSFGPVAHAWIFGAQLRMSVFSGGANQARQREAAHGQARAAAERERVEATVRFEALAAADQSAAAQAREVVGRAMVMQARESQRIIRDRFEAGMASASDVLRAASAVLDAEAQRIAALVDAMVSEVALQHAVGE